MLTETAEITAALAEARKRWPDDTPGQLLRRLIERGHQALREPATERRAAIAATAGSGTGLYGAGYLTELRGDWDRGRAAGE